MTAYQGHHTDGSSVQAHSVGDIYPYVIQIREIANGNGGWTRTYELLHPSGAVTSHQTREQAWSVASSAIIAKQDKEFGEASAALFEQLIPVINAKALTTIRASQLVIAQANKRFGIPVDRADQRDLEVALGQANLFKTFAARSNRDDQILALEARG